MLAFFVVSSCVILSQNDTSDNNERLCMKNTCYFRLTEYISILQAKRMSRPQSLGKDTSGHLPPQPYKHAVARLTGVRRCDGRLPQINQFAVQTWPVSGPGG